MNRRGFLAGIGSVAVAAVLPPVQAAPINYAVAGRPLRDVKDLFDTQHIRIVTWGESITAPIDGKFSDPLWASRMLNMARGRSFTGPLWTLQEGGEG